MRRRRRGRLARFLDGSFERSLSSLHGIERNDVKSVPYIGWRRRISALEGQSFSSRYLLNDRLITVGVDKQLQRVHRPHGIYGKFRKIEP